MKKNLNIFTMCLIVLSTILFTNAQNTNPRCRTIFTLNENEVASCGIINIKI
jgi:hypothetical protein